MDYLKNYHDQNNFGIWATFVRKEMANYKKGQELGIHGGVKRMHK
jgi:hypothetical protein